VPIERSSSLVARRDKLRIATRSGSKGQVLDETEKECHLREQRSFESRESSCLAKPELFKLLKSEVRRINRSEEIVGLDCGEGRDDDNDAVAEKAGLRSGLYSVE